MRQQIAAKKIADPVLTELANVQTAQSNAQEKVQASARAWQRPNPAMARVQETAPAEVVAKVSAVVNAQAIASNDIASRAVPHAARPSSSLNRFPGQINIGRLHR